MKQQYYNSKEQVEAAVTKVQILSEGLVKENQLPLKRVLLKFQNELLSSNVDPLILNKMSLEISNCLLCYEILLSGEEVKLFKQLLNLI